MISAVRLLCWDRPPSRRLEWLAQRGASLVQKDFGPLTRFWVWVERADGRRATRSPDLEPPRFRVRLVVELALAPAPVKPVARAESTSGTAEGALKRSLRILLADLHAQRQSTPRAFPAPQSVAHPPALPPL